MYPAHEGFGSHHGACFVVILGLQVDVELVVSERGAHFRGDLGLLQDAVAHLLVVEGVSHFEAAFYRAQGQLGKVKHEPDWQ